VLLGDVTGHGVGSAMVTAALASSYFSLRHLKEYADLSVLIRELNRNFCELCAGAYMMTLSALEIDPITGQMQWWSAAAPPILVLHKDGKVEAINTKGTPLGGATLDLEMQRYILKPKDRILVFSDGLSEAETSKGRQFGLRRIQQLLVETATETVTEKALQSIFSGFSASINPDSPQDDDITFAVIDRV
jgi:sigma-B regulation protein RsbU (phosphoserine phosphatase)